MVHFHIQNKHCWTGYTIYHKCDHPQLSTEKRATKAWLSPKSDAFVALQKIVLNTRLLKDLEHLTKFFAHRYLRGISFCNEQIGPKEQSLFF